MQDNQEMWWKQFLYAWRSIGECSSVDIEIEKTAYSKEYLYNFDKVPESISSSFKKYIYKPDSHTRVTKIKDANGGEISAFVVTSSGKTTLSIVDIYCTIDAVNIISGNGAQGEKNVDVNLHKITNSCIKTLKL
jgi:hypothetical protein